MAEQRSPKPQVESSIRSAFLTPSQWMMRLIYAEKGMEPDEPIYWVRPRGGDWRFCAQEELDGLIAAGRMDPDRLELGKSSGENHEST